MGEFPSLSVPVSVNPSGSAGGGNIFQVGSLFGSSSNGATSYGGDGASGSGSGQSSATPAVVAAATPTSAVSGTWLPYAILGGALVLAAMLFRHK